MERNTGVYLAINSKGQIKQTIITVKGEKIEKKTSVKKEIISFMEYNFKYYQQTVSILSQMCDSINLDFQDKRNELHERKFSEIVNFVNNLIEIMEEDDKFNGTLLRTLMEDAIFDDDGSSEYICQTKNDIVERLSEIILVQRVFDIVLDKLCKKEIVDIEKEFSEICQVGLMETVSLKDGKLRKELYFRSACIYYCYLFMLFIVGKPNIARCKCCGKYFIPKTKKVTLYCDRKIKGNKTCKQIAPHLKHKVDVRNDEIIALFDREKQKMYKRFERSSCSLNEIAHNLTLKEYNEWLENASNAKSRYLVGEISAEEARGIIEAKS